MQDPRKHNASATRNFSPADPQPLSGPMWQPRYAGGDCRGPSLNGQPQWSRASPRLHDTGSESETDEAHVSRLGQQQSAADQSAIMEELLRTRRGVFHAQVVRLLTVGNTVQHLGALSQVIDLINQAVAVAEWAQQTSPTSVGISSSTGSMPPFPSSLPPLRPQPPSQEVRISSPPPQPVNNVSYAPLPSLRSFTNTEAQAPQHTTHHQYYHGHQCLHSQTHQHPSSSSSSSSSTSVATSHQFSAPMQLLSPRMLMQESHVMRGMPSPRSPQQQHHQPASPSVATIPSSSSPVAPSPPSSSVMSPPLSFIAMEKGTSSSRNADASLNDRHDSALALSPPSSSSSSTSKPSSNRRGVKRHKRSPFQKDKDARELLQRMRHTIGEDVVWAPAEWTEMQHFDSSMSLSKFNAQHWPEELRLYRAAIPPKLWDALRFGRAMEFVYQKCLREPRTERAVEGQDGEVLIFTWKRWLQTYCIPHGINVQVANRNRRMWRVVRSYPLMQFSSVSLRELNKNVCGISRYLSTDPEAREFWSQTFKGFVSTLPSSSMPPTSPNALTARGKRKRAASEAPSPSSAVHRHHREDTSSLDLLASATIKNELERDDDEGDEVSDDSDALSD